MPNEYLLDKKEFFFPSGPVLMFHDLLCMFLFVLQKGYSISIHDVAIRNTLFISSSAPFNDALSCHCYCFVFQMDMRMVVSFELFCAQNDRPCY